jgi:acetyl esterase/lipase
VGYFVAIVSVFLAVSALTALRPGRKGIFQFLAYPVGWAAGELAGQAFILQCALVGLLVWWGWPSSSWLGEVVVIVAAVVVGANAILIGVQFLSRRVVRRAMLDAPVRPLEIPKPRDDQFGSWWRTMLQIPWHPKDMILTKNVYYGPLPRHRLDIWRQSTTPQHAPVIYYIHGGAWTFGDKREQGRPMLHEFVRRGWSVVAINYRLAPKYGWPAQIEDVTRALGWIKKNIASRGGDPERIVVAGGSAGGHLAALLALTANDPTWRPAEMRDFEDWSVRGCISLYGVLEMMGDPVVWQGRGRGLVRLLEEAVVLKPLVGNEDIYRALSPLQRLHEDAPPFLVIHGGNDTLVDVNVARTFVERFRDEAFAPIYYVEIPLTQHAFDVTASPRTSSTTRAAVAFGEACAERVSPPSDELLDLYEVPSTELRVNVDGEQFTARDAADRIGDFVVVTSANPYSQLRTAAENEQSHAALLKDLARRGEHVWQTEAIDQSGSWPDETGVALAGWSLERARSLAQAWGQHAFYSVTRDDVVVHRTTTTPLA